jgi:uncharacterized surface protein with fasciclin (FAS1) repeats
MFLGLCFLAMTTMVSAQGEISADKKAFKAQVSMEKAGPDIVDIAASKEDFSTLVAAVKAADLVGALKAEGAFTVFAPTNAAFAKLPAGTVESLLKPENKTALQGVLTYHVVSGEFMAKDVIAAIKKNNGSFKVTTLAGGTLVASLKGDSVILTDENGQVITVVAADVDASNGVIHVVDTVCLPK